MENPTPEQPVIDNIPATEALDPSAAPETIPEPVFISKEPDPAVVPAGVSEPAPLPRIISMSAALGTQPLQQSLNPKIKWPMYLAAIILTVSLGAGIALASRIWDPMWNPFRPVPGVVMAIMYKNQLAVKTFSTKADFSISASTDQGDMEVKAGYDGSVDKTDEKNMKVDLIGKASFGMMGISMEMGGEAMKIGDDGYFKITKIPSFLLSYISSSDSPLKANRWVKIGKDSSENLANKLKEKKDELYLTDEDIKSYTDGYSSGQEALSSQSEDQIKNILSNYELYSVAKEFPDEKIGQIEVYHYQVSVNKDVMKKVILEAVKSQVEKQPDSNFDEKSAGESLDKVLKAIGEMSGDIWIGKKDNLLYRFKTEKEISSSDFEDILSSEEKDAADSLAGGSDNITIKLGGQIDFSNYNGKVDIKIPDKSDNFEDLMISYIGSSSDSKKYALNAKIEAYMDQIRSTSIIYQASSNGYIGLANNEDYKSLVEKINSSRGNLTSNISAKNFCAYTPLIMTEYDTGAKYWCIDSNGSSGSSSEDPGKKGYCDGKTFKCPSSSSSW
jgi:hypothetical protein